MPSKHINTQPGDFADTVLMPGDPLRAQRRSTYDEMIQLALDTVSR